MAKRKSFNLLGEVVAPGKSGRFNLEVAKLHTNTPIQVPVIVQHARREGPVLLLLAGAHGDEINGIEIVRRIIKNGWNKPQAGTVICIPVYNIFGFLNLRREFPDGRDLNRSFPGTKNGSLASQFAYHFMTEIAPKVDIVLDFHTGAAQRSNYPHTRCDFKNKETLSLCKAFGAPFVLNSGLVSKSIRAALTKMGKQYILFEGGKANRTDEAIVEVGVNGVKNIMNHFKMRSFNLTESDENPQLLLKSSKWIRASNSGMLTLRVENGTWVERGTILATIADPYGKFERSVKASKAGYIINVNETPLVNKGDAVFHLAFE